MQTFPRGALALLPFLAGAPAVAEAQEAAEPAVRHPFLWRIEGEVAHHLYGTIHLPDRRVTRLPASVVAALEACDVLLTEIELDARTQAELQKATLLPKGRRLADLLPADLYERLAGYAKRRNFPIAAMERQKLWIVAATLPLLDDLRALLSGKALDALLVQEAKDRDKDTAALETVAEQVGAFEAFTTEEQVELLAATLDLLEKAEKEKRSIVQELVELYVAGDLGALHGALDELSGLAGHEALEAKFEKVLITDRNVRMAERIAERLRQAPGRSHFFAVGAAHYAGEQGILALLRAKGFRIERVGGEPPGAGTGEEKGRRKEKAVPEKAGAGRRGA